MKSNYRIIFSLLLIILSLVSISSVSAITYTDSANLIVFAEEISPEPVEPGQDLTLKIRLLNLGGDTAENVFLNLNTDYPFFVKTDSSNFDNNVSVCGGCSLDNTYYLSVDANAKSGLYPLDFEIYSDSSFMKSGNTINIKVVGKPDVILKTNSIGADISSGDLFTIDFEVENIGTGIARNIKITPQSDDILMIGSNFNLVDKLNPNTFDAFSSEFIVKESLVPDTYKFPVKIEYIDEQGNNYETSFDIGVNVLNKADINFQSIKIIPLNPTIVDDIHLEGILENIGSGDANKVTIELITKEGKIYQSFIGQLQSDDDAPFYFDSKPESVGMQEVTIKVSYIDDFGLHSFETILNQEVGKPTNNIIIVIVVFVIIFSGIGYYHFKKQKNN